MFISETEAQELHTYLLRMTDQESKIRMIRIFLDGAYVRGKLAGIWTVNPNAQAYNLLETSQNTPKTPENHEDTYEIRKNGGCEDGGSPPAVSADHTYDCGKC